MGPIWKTNFQIIFKEVLFKINFECNSTMNKQAKQEIALGNSKTKIKSHGGILYYVDLIFLNEVYLLKIIFAAIQDT